MIDELPAAFCSDAVGILGVALGTKVVADTELTDQVVKWISKFLKKATTQSALRSGSAVCLPLGISNSGAC